MALSLTCDCGARFEVEDTLAGQEVTCPECQAPLKAPALQRLPLRTSGFALASVILALVGAATLVGPVAAVVLGVTALVSIARNPQRVAGVGFAAFGIVAGVAFTALDLLAFTRTELLGFGGWVNERRLAGQIDTGGPLEVEVRAKGFALTRPSDKWGQVRDGGLEDPLVALFQEGRDLLLVQPRRYAFVDVRVVESGNTKFLGLDECREIVLDEFRPPQPQAGGPRGGLVDDDDDPQPFRPHVSARLARQPTPLPNLGDFRGQELLVEVRGAGGKKLLQFLIRMYKKTNGPLYIVRAYTQQRHYPALEGELRKALDSFRILN
jgi:hypothetical protein